ncbi:Tip elongation aberrant protein 1 [Cyphellophora attinorum]|uniref:Tip elongation aberrant protein 1 n=1 Tax=Cyphellophora attinorum TaxID=1664694 RepID=A0A0N1H6T5_9EURO|nr:Tip elongation aberrant protein 1 [Phialophora attinorum]KPI37146.1 Tip elongation aberrant protein 1 [Phialophora attinorum]
MVEKQLDPRQTQSPQPTSNPDGSISSIGSMTGPSGQFARRDRAESESGTRPATVGAQPPNAALYPWSQRRLNFPTPQSNPFPRYGAAVNSVASKEGDIYMMGGLINGSMVRGDLWMLESGGGNLSCYPIATVSEGPGPRVGHASLLVGNAFIVFGGDTKMDDSDVLDDTLYLLNTSSRQWSRATPPGQRPPGRYGHTLNILGSKIYIFGGQVEGYFFNDLLAFDLNALQNPGNTWEFLMQNEVDGGLHGPRPAPRTNHTVISYNDQMFLFGGTNGTRWFNDVWSYDPKANAWTEMGCIGYIPAPREGHSAALVGDVMYIFGGRTEEGNDLGDLAAFRITSKRWYTFQNMGPSPSPRSGHSMTAHGKQIIVLAGEPSSAPRDSGELSMVYVLDTSKIRYPSDSAAPPSGEKQRSGSPQRRPSSEARNPKRSQSREGQIANDAFARASPMGGPVQRPDGSRPDGATNSAQGSRLPRASQAPAGPPPQGQPPNPRVNGTMSPPNGVRNRPAQDKSQQIESIQAPAVKAVQKEASRPSRDNSPSSHGRRTPTQTSKARAMEAGEAAPMVGPAVARQRSLRSQRAQGSIDSTEEGALGRGGSNRHHSDTQSSVRSHYDEPRSPKLSAHQEALVKELDSAKRTNAWYASELALARKAGYAPSGSSNSTIDDKNLNQFSDDDKPLIEAFMAMRAEMVKMHQAMEQQSSSTAKRIAEVEHQRDAAVTEAAYARAKLAAHGGSQRSTPQPDHSDDADRSTDISRRLALALAATNDHKAKIDVMHNDLAAEKRAREAAEESSEAAHRRLEELSQGRNPAELDGLRAELHEAQGNARSEASFRAEAEEKLRILQAEFESITEKHDHGSSRLKDSVASIAALEAAVAASSGKVTLYERQLEQERSARETAERKLSQLRSEHEERTNELETATKRLRDAEELADTHAQEANTHRAALMAGLAKLSTSDRDVADRGPSEQRLAALQENADKANALAKQHHAAADAVADKLRAAEERIAGLEAYQEQSSRDGVQIRRQLQAALRDAQAYQAELREVKSSYESHQRDASALAVQHGALKDLLGERGMDMSNARRSPAFGESPASRFGTPEQGRLKELEHQLQNSMKSHEETRSQFESRMQEADSTYREKLEQLENDYQSAVHYVKGTEKMLKKMKEELTKYKTQNAQLQTELESAQSTSREVVPDSANQDGLQKEMDSLKTQLTGQISTLESNLAAVRAQLASTQEDHNKQSAQHEKLLRSTQQTEKELEQLKHENSMLQGRAEEAEQRVTMLLDQVGTTVGNYRRQSQLPPPGANGISHLRDPSESTATDTSSPDDNGKPDERGSVALDHLASELETLKSQWESTSRNNYRLSGLDFERTPTNEAASGEQMSDSLADWRRRLDEEEKTSPPAALKQK